MKWRNSPSESLLRGLENIPVAENGKNIFPSLLAQTRFIVMAEQCLRGRIHTSKVLDHDNRSRPIMIGKEFALTAQPEEINYILKILYLYQYLNGKRDVKLPKYLYRGIRFSDIWSQAEIKKITSAPDKTESHPEWMHKIIDALKTYIIQNGLSKITETSVVSSSSKQAIAKFFTNESGLILRLDPKRVHIVTSEAHDQRLNGATYHTKGVDEKEWIIQIPVGYKWENDDIDIVSADYHIAINSPLFVNQMKGVHYYATYEMHGYSITARGIWYSGNRFVKLFNGQSRAEFKKSYGFDPIPIEKTLKDVSNFEIHRKN